MSGQLGPKGQYCKMKDMKSHVNLIVDAIGFAVAEGDKFESAGYKDHLCKVTCTVHMMESYEVDPYLTGTNAELAETAFKMRCVVCAVRTYPE